MGVTWIGQNMRTALKNFRTVTRQEGFIVLVRTTGAGGFKSWDAYNRVEPEWVDNPNVISGALAWGKTYKNVSTEGGDYSTADLTITASLDNKGLFTGAGAHTETKINCKDKKLKVIDFIELEDTNEMVIYCEQLSD